MGSHSRWKTEKGSAFIDAKGFRVNCDGTTIENRKPNLKICSNHKRAVVSGTKARAYPSHIYGQALSDGRNWYKPANPDGRKKKKR